MSYPPPTGLSPSQLQQGQRPLSALSDSSYYPPEADPADHHLSRYSQFEDAPHRSSADYYSQSMQSHSISAMSPSPSDPELLTHSPRQVHSSEHDPMLNYSPGVDPLHASPLHSPQSQFTRRGSDSTDTFNYGDGGRFSRGASSMNISEIGDAESQRGILPPGSGVGDTLRRGQIPRSQSGLQYGYGYGDKEEEEEEVLGGAAGAAAGGRLKRRSGGSAPVSRGTSGRRAAAATGSKRGRPTGGGSLWTRMSPAKKRLLVLGVVLAIVVIGVAAAVPAVLSSSHKKSNAAAANDSSSSSSSSSSTSTSVTSAPSGVPTGTAGADWKVAAVGGDQSVVYTEDGSSFVYNNTFGGFWNAIPFNDSAQAQSDVPPLNQQWDYNVDLIQGVNLGGWLLLEPFIAPALFEPFNPSGGAVNHTATVVDEWTLSVALGTSMATTIENHYATFITEKDFAEIAGAGLNWVRIPIPYWAIEVWDGEPFLAGVGWTYFLKAVAWARKYGLRINLDLHAVPGSQNGYNHSSKLGTINFLNGVMGIANAQRTLNYIRTLAEFITQDQYKNVIPMFSVLNEPYAATIGVDNLRHFYIETYNLLRNSITGIGEGQGPIIMFHDGFVDQSSPVASGGWDGFLGGADRIGIDSHPYLCFSIPPSGDSVGYDATKPCAYWGAKFNESTANFGISVGGEWSLAINDCGQWINNIGNGQRYEGSYFTPGNITAPANKGIGSCDSWNDWSSWNSSTKAGLQTLAYAHMDALRHWFFWTWKTGVSSLTNTVANPFWNYQLALENGYMPKNPRAFKGTCASVVKANGVAMSTFPAPSLSAWATGGSGAGTLLATASSQLSSWSAWPPTQIGGTSASNFPTYTATGSVITMTAGPTPTSYPSGYSSTPDLGDGWAQSTDSGAWSVAVAGCTYLNPWSGAGAASPTAACTGAAKKMMVKERAVPTAVPTAPPRV